MKKELFEELLQSVRDGGKILRGEMPPSRRFVVPDSRAGDPPTGTGHSGGEETTADS